MAGSGTTTVDFGAFPGKADASAAVTGQASILAGSIVGAWLYPAATADHSADEHVVEAVSVTAGAVSAGTGFTIWATEAGVAATRQDNPRHPSTGNEGHRLYGLFTVAWAWA